MEEYLTILLEQIRCKKARPAIEQELRSHIEDQAAANVLAGMDGEEALSQAIQDMGDPVEAGIRLNRIHRPKMAWDVAGIMALIAFASILLHIVIGIGAEEINNLPRRVYISRAVGYTLAGFAAMLLVYRLDYSVLVKRGKLCAGIFLAGLTFGIFAWNQQVHGPAFVHAGISFSPVYAMFLYVPLYGAVLYQYRKTGWGGLVKAFLFLLYPVFLAFRIPCISVAVLLLLIMSAMLSAAVWEGWFLIQKKRALALYWAALAAMPAVWVFMAVHGVLREYQRMRVLAFLDDGFRQYSYVTNMLVELLEGSRFFGGSKEAVAGGLPDYYSSYILAFVSSYYGIAVACMACLLILVVSVKAFRIAYAQGSQLGRIMGLGSGLVLFCNTLLNILENMGIFPATTTFLPFFSYTGCGILVSYILIGVVLSVYRYKNILPVCGCKKQAVGAGR